jgi:WD40 repeat protein
MVQRFLMVSLFGLLAVGWCHAGDAAKKEPAKLEGAWVFVKMEISGKSLPKEDEPKTTFIIKDGKISSDAKEARGKGFELSKIIEGSGGRVTIWSLPSALPVPKTSPATVADEPDGKDIDGLVKQLGSTDFRMRAAATKRLQEIGAPALDALYHAATSNDVEARRRAEEILLVIENELYAEQMRFTGHQDKVWVVTVTVSADGKRVLTGSLDGTMRLWEADTGKELQSFKHNYNAGAPALSPDGLRVLSASGGGSGDSLHIVHLWDAATGKELQRMIGHTQWVRSVAFGPPGMAISGSNDRTMRLWDLHTGKTTGLFTHPEGVCSVAYSDNAKLAATGSEDQTIRLWNLETGQEVRKLSGHTRAVSGVCFVPDGKRLLSFASSTLRIWDVEAGKPLKEMQAHKPPAFCVALSPDGKRIVSGSENDHTVRVWDATTGKELRPYEGHTGKVFSVAFFPDGKRIASASQDGTVRIWGAPR